MSIFNRRLGLVAAWLLMVAAGGFFVPVRGAEEAAKEKRTQQQVMTDLMAASQQLQAVLKSPQDLFDEAKRAEVAPKVMPLMKKMLGLLDEMGEVQPTAKAQMQTGRMQFLAMLSLLGDADSAAALEKATGSANASEATLAKGSQLLVRWWKAAKNAAEQAKVADEIQALAKANPESEELTQVVATMCQQGAANDEMKARAQKIVTDDLKSKSAQRMVEQIKREQKLKELTGKPLAIEGVKVDGTKFTSADWKGKVVLVDFWATWCGPCLAELPNVKKIYAQYHDKGLEMIGVSCDRDEAALTKFLAENKDMPWPQLYDKAKPGWHALATQYGVNGIPTMFLIDKQGIVRTVEARGKLEELIPKMLEEK
jgi:thiol-disulfide isomerase/thioredoxin